MIINVGAYRNGDLQYEKSYSIDSLTALSDALEIFNAEFPQYSDCIVIAEESEEATWIEAVYAPAADTTFIMEYHRNADGLIVSEKVVGFYHGEPEPGLTEEYKDKGTVAEF